MSESSLRRLGILAAHLFAPWRRTLAARAAADVWRPRCPAFCTLPDFSMSSHLSAEHDLPLVGSAQGAAAIEVVFAPAHLLERPVLIQRRREPGKLGIRHRVVGFGLPQPRGSRDPDRNGRGRR